MLEQVRFFAPDNGSSGRSRGNKVEPFSDEAEARGHEAFADALEKHGKKFPAGIFREIADEVRNRGKDSSENSKQEQQDTE